MSENVKAWTRLEKKNKYYVISLQFQDHLLFFLFPRIYNLYEDYASPAISTQLISCPFCFSTSCLGIVKTQFDV